MERTVVARTYEVPEQTGWPTGAYHFSGCYRPIGEQRQRRHLAASVERWPGDNAEGRSPHRGAFARAWSDLCNQSE